MEHNGITDVDDILDSGLPSIEGSELKILYNKIGRMCLEYGHLMCALSTNSRTDVEPLKETQRKAEELSIQIRILEKEVEQINSRKTNIIDISTSRKFKGPKIGTIQDDTPNIVA